MYTLYKNICPHTLLVSHDHHHYMNKGFQNSIIRAGQTLSGSHPPSLYSMPTLFAFSILMIYSLTLSNSATQAYLYKQHTTSQQLISAYSAIIARFWQIGAFVVFVEKRISTHPAAIEMLFKTGKTFFFVNFSNSFPGRVNYISYINRSMKYFLRIQKIDHIFNRYFLFYKTTLSRSFIVG